jgi:hypothetical protein
VQIRLTSAQLHGIFTTGSASTARSATVEGAVEELTSRAETALARVAGGKVGRTVDGMLVADRSGPIAIEEWVVHVSAFGPKATVSLRAARAIRAWVIVAVWFGLSTAFGVAAVAVLFLITPQPPELAPGLVFAGGLIVLIVASQALAKRQANRWALATHSALGNIASALSAASPPDPYR